MSRADAEAAGELDARLTADLMRFTAVVNATGLPAISVPVGRDGAGEAPCGLLPVHPRIQPEHTMRMAAGMPVGLQIVGRAWEESRLLDLASTLMQHLAGSHVPPQAGGPCTAAVQWTGPAHALPITPDGHADPRLPQLTVLAVQVSPRCL